MVDPFSIAAGIAGAGLGFFGQQQQDKRNVALARENREWQERMANTAHQREMADLKKAGINPMLRHMSGAATPTGDRAEVGDPVGKGAASAMEAMMMRAQLSLLREQAGLTRDQAAKARTEAADIQQSWNAGKFDTIRSQAEAAALSVEQQRRMLPLVLQRARAEIDSMASSAEAAKARAALDRAAETGALNLQEFERNIGEIGPWLRSAYYLLRAIGDIGRSTR